MTALFLTLPAGSPLLPPPPPPPPPPPHPGGEPHIVLVGLPGSGKSTAGALLARVLGRLFLDFDREIEARTRMSIARIFAELGEQTFRTLERQLTEQMATIGGMVLAPGGGWVTNEGSVALLRPVSRIIYLRIRVHTALERLRASEETRPLLTGADPLAVLGRLLVARGARYEEADDVIDVDNLAPQELTRRLAKLAESGLSD